MYEIEAKVPLSRIQFDTLKYYLDQKALYKGQYLKTDTYFGDSQKELIRVRQQKQEYLFHLKLRSSKKGIEQNIEIEWLLKNPKKFKAILKKAGISKQVKKQKKTILYAWKNFSIELNYVSKLGYFLEVEKTTGQKGMIPEIQKKLLTLFAHFGFKESQFEKRPYLKLLTHQ